MSRRTTDNGQRTIRAGVTLIELLIVILIISILAALVLGVAAVAAETARQAQTRHTVERLHTLLTEHYGTYKTRRVKLQSHWETDIQKNITSTANRGQALAEARLYAMREMMLMEIPDRWSDVLLWDIGTGSGPPANTPYPPIYLEARTDLSNVYLRRYLGLIGRTNTITGKPNTADDLKANQSAECLYMIVMLACGDGEARTLFAESNIGDTDGDGAPEFLDGWGHPISFLRWAPGFDSQIQLNANNLQTTDSTLPTYWPAAAAKDHDPFDVYRVDGHAFRLTPLIYSFGRNEASGIDDFPDYAPWLQSKTSPAYGVLTTSPYVFPRLTPYELGGSTNPGLTAYLGTDTGEGTSADNVHNHLMGQR